MLYNLIYKKLMCVSWVECSPTIVLSVSNVLVEANKDNNEIKYLSHGNLSDFFFFLNGNISDMSTSWLGSTYSVESSLSLLLKKEKEKRKKRYTHPRNF